MNNVLETAGLRSELDLSKEKVGYKIRQQTLKKVPYMMVIGANEVETGQVNLRLRSGEQYSFDSIESVLDYLQESCRPPDVTEKSKALEYSLEELKAH